MGAAGDHPHSQVHPLGQKQMGRGDHGLFIGRVVEDLQSAVVHIDRGIPADMGPGYHLQHPAGADPKAGAQAGRPLEHVIVGAHRIQSDQTAHGGAGDDGIHPVREGPIVLVDVGLQGLDQPVHIDIALALDLAVLGVLISEGGILDQALVALVVALHTDDDQFLLALLHEAVHAPGFSEGGILIEKDIVSVEHIHDGVALLRFLLIGGRKVDICFSGLLPGKFWNGNVPLFDPVALSSVSV